MNTMNSMQQQASQAVQRLQGTWRSAMGRMTNQMFPVRKQDLEKIRLQTGRTGLEYATFLPLQIVYYFNAFFAPFWIVGFLLSIVDKYSKLNYIYQPILIALFCLYCILEFIRLYIGYFGNLSENIADLAGSWLITTVIQLPAICFFLFNYFLLVNPFEIVMHSVEFIFVLLEVIMGLYTIKVFQTVQALKFHHKMEYFNADGLDQSGESREDGYVYYNNAFEGTELRRRTAGQTTIA
ncbi:hypothetical protein BOX15_Mlig019782g1 [Macrostomum lignano]|uniref:Transmembrane protein 17 n=1 Tax=Macrostomum lignano TaxID=282301 RepID=A0A267GWU3_9PLAT|nr:hypothetical protein BOX15_Mlig019782g1 [Macrostomum lignano]